MTVTSAQIKEFEPLIKKLVNSAMRTLPGNVERDDLMQVGRIAIADNLPKFDGRGSVEGYLSVIIRNRFVDFLRQEFPGSRQGQGLQTTSLDEMEDFDPAGESDHAEDIARGALQKAKIAALPMKMRAIVGSTLDGQSMTDTAQLHGITVSRVSQIVSEARGELEKPVRKTPDSFDPQSIKIIKNLPVPPAQPKRRNKFKEAIQALGPTDATILANSVAASLVSQMKKDGIRHCVRTHPCYPTHKIVWREPSPEQLKGNKNV